MADIFGPYIFGTYRLLWDDPGAGSFGMVTTGDFPQGVDVYVSTAIANARHHDNVVAQNRGNILGPSSLSGRFMEPVDR